MPALVAGIHVLRRSRYKDVDGRNKSGQDDPIGLNAMRKSSSSRKGLLPNPHPGEILAEEFLKPMRLRRLRSRAPLACRRGGSTRSSSASALSPRTQTYVWHVISTYRRDSLWDFRPITNGWNESAAKLVFRCDQTTRPAQARLVPLHYNRFIASEKSDDKNRA
jgi:hypothetical protein